MARRQDLEDNTVLGLGITALVLGGGYWFGLKPLLDKMAAENQLKKDQASTIKAAKGKPLFDLTGKPVKSANLATIATDLFDSLRFPTDDPRVVRVFNTTPFGYVPQLEKVYLDKYKRDLKTDLVQNLNDKSWISIKYNFR